MVVIDVDHRGAVRIEKALEQNELRLEIGREGEVIVEMIAGDVGEARHRDAHAVEPVLVESMRGRFEREMSDAGIGEARERRVQFDGIGRGERAVPLLRRRHEPDRSDARGGEAERRPDLPGEGGDRGLSAGAGDGGDDCGLPREEFRRRKRERAAHIGRQHQRDIVGQGRGRSALREDRDRAGCERGGNVAQSVGLAARHRREQEAGLDRAAVGANARYRTRRMTLFASCVGREKVVQTHAGPVLAPKTRLGVTGLEHFGGQCEANRG